MTFDIVSEPTDRTYRLLLAFCGNYASTVLLIVRQQSLLTDSARAVLESLEPYRRRVERRSEWPGTVLLGHGADVHEYQFNDEVLLQLQTAASGLYQWVHPDLPEDLCLIKSDGTPILVTIAHEEDGYLILEAHEARQLLAVAPDLQLSERH